MQVKVYLANLKLNRIYHFEKQKIIANDYLTQTCSNEFIDIYNKSDIIISKGQGNYEALSEERGNVFFLLKAKCPMIASRLEVELGSYVFKNNKFKNK